MEVFCFYLMMEIVVESSSITEIPSVLPFFRNMVPCCFQYEEAREKLIHDMFLLSGSMHLSLEVLLTVGADEEVSLTACTFDRWTLI
jgi:hypothetical protein